MKTAERFLGVPMLLTAILLIAPSVGRCDDESEKMLQYRPRVDASIELALAFLATTYSAGPYNGGAMFPGEYGNSNAIAGLVGMAFLAKGYVPGESPYGQIINACADKILRTDISAKTSPGPDGKPVIMFPAGYLGNDGGRMYGHAIATLFLSEISGMVDSERQKKIDEVLPKAVKLILDAQNVVKTKPNYNGGWRYVPTSADSDVSVTGWCIMSLRSASLNGAPVPKTAIERAMKYLDGLQNPDGGYYYSDLPYWYGRRGYWVGVGPSTASLTGAGMLCRELCGHHDDDRNRKAAALLLSRIGGWKGEGHVEYATYYSAQGMFQIGGENWEKFGAFLYSHLLSTQLPSGAWKGQSGEVYPTCMYVLALSVSCRQLPIYQR